MKKLKKIVASSIIAVLLAGAFSVQARDIVSTPYEPKLDNPDTFIIICHKYCMDCRQTPYGWICELLPSGG